MNNNKTNPYNIPVPGSRPPKNVGRPLYNNPITDDILPNQNIPNNFGAIPQKTDTDTVPVKFDPKTGGLFVPKYPNYDNYFKDALSFMDAFTNKLPVFKIEEIIKPERIVSTISSLPYGDGVYSIVTPEGPELVLAEISSDNYSRYTSHGTYVWYNSSWDPLNLSPIKEIKEYQNTNDKINESFDSIPQGIYTAKTMYGDELWLIGVFGKLRITSFDMLTRNESTKQWDNGLFIKKDTLLSNGKIKTEYIPAIAITQTNVVSSIEEMLQLTAQEGDVAIISGVGSYILKGNDPKQLGSWVLLVSPTDSVLSVNGKTGSVTLNLEDLPDSEQKLNQVKEDAVAEALDQIGNVDVQTKTSPTRDFIVESAHIEELDSEGYIINIFDTQIESIQTTDTDSEVYGKLMEYFRTLFGLGSINYGFNAVGKQGARGRFLCHPDYCSSDFGEALSYYFEYKSNVYQEEVDSFVVECIGAKESEAECTMTIDLYDKSGDYYRLQIYCYHNNGVSKYISKGWEKETNKLELLDLSGYDIGEDLGYIGELIYNNPTRYLIKVKKDGYNMYLHYSYKNEEYGETWWRYQLISGEECYIENGTIYIVRNGEWALDESFKIIVTNVLGLRRASSGGNEIAGIFARQLLQDYPENAIINAQIAGYNAPFVFSQYRGEDLIFKGSVVDAQLGIIASSNLIIDTYDWSCTLEETIKTIAGGSSSASSNIINISNYENGEVLDDEHFSAISENPKNILLLYYGILCCYIEESDDVYYYKGSTIFAEDSQVENAYIFIDKTTHILTEELYDNGFASTSYIDAQVNSKAEIIDIGTHSISNLGFGIQLSHEQYNKITNLQQKAVITFNTNIDNSKKFAYFVEDNGAGEITYIAFEYRNSVTSSNKDLIIYEILVTENKKFYATRKNFQFLQASNIATINGQVLTNGGDITIEGGAGAKVGITLSGKGQNFKGKKLYFDTSTHLVYGDLDFSVDFYDSEGELTAYLSAYSEYNDEFGTYENAEIIFDNNTTGDSYLIYSEATGWRFNEIELGDEHDCYLYEESIFNRSRNIDYIVSIENTEPIVIVDNARKEDFESSNQKFVPTTKAVMKEIEELWGKDVERLEEINEDFHVYEDDPYLNAYIYEDGITTRRTLCEIDYGASAIEYYLENNKAVFVIAGSDRELESYRFETYAGEVGYNINIEEILANSDRGDEVIISPNNTHYAYLAKIVEEQTGLLKIETDIESLKGKIQNNDSNKWEKITEPVMLTALSFNHSCEIYIKVTELFTNFVPVFELEREEFSVRFDDEDLNIYDPSGSMAFNGYLVEDNVYKFDLPPFTSGFNIGPIENNKAFLVKNKEGKKINIDIAELFAQQGEEIIINLVENGEYLLTAYNGGPEKEISLTINFGYSKINSYYGKSISFLNGTFSMDTMDSGYKGTQTYCTYFGELGATNGSIYIKVEDNLVTISVSNSV